VKFHSPSSPGGDRHAPANAPGLRHVAFAVEDIDAVVAGLRARGAELVGEDGMVRIVVTPTWAKLIDFETTLPSAVEELIRQRDERQRA
jgi:hypothetical protein